MLEPLRRNRFSNAIRGSQTHGLHISVGVGVFGKYEAWNAVCLRMKLRKDFASREERAGLSDDHNFKTVVAEDVTRLFVG